MARANWRQTVSPSPTDANWPSARSDPENGSNIVDVTATTLTLTNIRYVSYDFSIIRFCKPF